MTHAEAGSKLSPYLEGELSLAQRARLDAHLDQCAECREALQVMRAGVALLRGLPDPEPPAGLGAAVMARLDAGEGLRSPWRWLAVAAPSVAVATIAAVGLWGVQSEPEAGAPLLAIEAAVAPSPQADARLRGAHEASEPSDPVAASDLDRVFADPAAFVTAMQRDPARLDRVVDEAEHHGRSTAVATQLRQSGVAGAETIAVRFERVRFQVGD